MMIDKEALQKASAKIRIVEYDDFRIGIRLIGAADVVKLRDLDTSDERTPAENVRSMATFLSYCLCDENGKLLFAPTEVAELEQLPIDLLGKLLRDAQEVNGMSPEAREERRKNSEGGPTSDST